ncbi:hypothetical protein CAPTEDRAFT_214703 [Capitella teleta]|uniref:SH3 domain-containing protein n=1 Tax=Capitella teleta TaxID=283909 RepID=R7TCE6_CAPTE|nr:hypothetical protein CAPTEDRAFT_214703 [Capitella teleta]|eukprot:ELT91379.1 hypothetical protein CAPTEDRAFT_214703 [Capitella teleta]
MDVYFTNRAKLRVAQLGDMLMTIFSPVIKFPRKQLHVEEGELYQDAESPQEAPTKVQDEESDKEIYDDTAEDIYETYDDVAPETVKPLQAKAVSPPVAEPGNYFERLYYCVYDLHGDDDDELSCCYGDVIEILSKSHCGMNWWVAKYDDRIGIVPKDYLSPVYGTVN